MNTSKLKDALQRTLVRIKQAPKQAIAEKQERQERIVYYQSYTTDRIKTLSEEEFCEELSSFEKKLEEITGECSDMLYRPPQGKYNVKNLQMAKGNGYNTFFWSLAYVDWYDDDQPTKEEAFDKLLTRIHPGSIVLLHVTSKTNSEILPELIQKWKDMGYTFGSLEELTL